MKIIKKISTWLSDDRRVALQAFLATLGVLAVQLGYISEEQNGLVLVLAGAALQLVQATLALAYLRPSEAWVWLGTVGRGLIYAAAAAAAPVAVAFGIATDAQTATTLTAVSTGLTALSAFIAVLNNRAQYALAA
jgi:hypothetical protein